MFTDPAVALRWTEVLVGLALVQGTLELLAVRHALRDDGTWRWATLAPELRWLAPVLAYRPFVLLLGLRLAAALALVGGIHGPVAPVLWLTSLLVNVRFRGTTNGGSDMMQMVVLTGVVAAHAGALVAGALFAGASHAMLLRGALLYIAAQAFMSYFVAGVAKLASGAWRDGRALQSFLATPHFAVPAALQRWLGSAPRRRAASWGVIVFECAVPLALTTPVACAGYLAVALGFHVGNAWAFGLNRFVLAWAASWPALLYASTLMA